MVLAKGSALEDLGWMHSRTSVVFIEKGQWMVDVHHHWLKASIFGAVVNEGPGSDVISRKPLTCVVNMSLIPCRLPYNQYFGGVSSMSKEQYLKINGFPNNYWGWGGEDDDIYNRWPGAQTLDH